MPSTTRGPLPTGTYWRRRLAVLSVALVLVLAFGKVLTHGSDGSGGDGRAAQAGSTTRSSFPPPDSASATRTATAGKTKGRNRGQRASASAAVTDTSTPVATATPTPTPTPTPPLADPTGPCAADDVYITPTVASAVAGSPVTITLNLQSQTSEACTWTVSPDTVTMKLTTGTNGVDTVWTSRECPKVIPTQDVVVRRALATQVTMTWDAKRSDEYCTGQTAYAMPGTYHAYAATLGGEPTDVTFEMTTPLPAQITETVTPTPTPTPTAPASKSGKGKKAKSGD